MGHHVCIMYTYNEHLHINTYLRMYVFIYAIFIKVPSHTLAYIFYHLHHIHLQQLKNKKIIFNKLLQQQNCIY